MFPRVLGYLAGRAAAQVYQFFQNPENQERVAQAAVETAALVALPAPARPLLAAYRIWSLFNPTHELQLRNPRSNQNASDSAGNLNSSLDCYLRGAQASDPVLISPVGTLPFERCLDR